MMCELYYRMVLLSNNQWRPLGFYHKETASQKREFTPIDRLVAEFIAHARAGPVPQLLELAFRKIYGLGSEHYQG
jgi:hypothetical protein